MQSLPQDLIFLRRAITLAESHSAQGCGGPFGALVVRGRTLIGEGWNKVTSTNDPTAHAEIVAIRQAARKRGDYRLTGCTLYASCEPCPMCLAACHWARLSRVVYAATRRDAARIGFDDERLYRAICGSARGVSLSMTSHLRSAAVEMMMRWHAMPGRKLY